MSLGRGPRWHPLQPAGPRCRGRRGRGWSSQPVRGGDRDRAQAEPRCARHRTRQPNRRLAAAGRLGPRSVGADTGSIPRCVLRRRPRTDHPRATCGRTEADLALQTGDLGRALEITARRPRPDGTCTGTTASSRYEAWAAALAGDVVAGVGRPSRRGLRRCTGASGTAHSVETGEALRPSRRGSSRRRAGAAAGALRDIGADEGTLGPGTRQGSWHSGLPETRRSPHGPAGMLQTAGARRPAGRDTLADSA